MMGQSTTWHKGIIKGNPLTLGPGRKCVWTSDGSTERGLVGSIVFRSSLQGWRHTHSSSWARVEGSDSLIRELPRRGGGRRGENRERRRAQLGKTGRRREFGGKGKSRSLGNLKTDC